MGFQKQLEEVLRDCPQYIDTNGQLDIVKIDQDASTVYTTACTNLHSLKKFPQTENDFYNLASEYFLYERCASINFVYLIEHYITECQFHAYLYMYFLTKI